MSVPINSGSKYGVQGYLNADKDGDSGKRNININNPNNKFKHSQYLDSNVDSDAAELNSFILSSGIEPPPNSYAQSYIKSNVTLNKLGPNEVNQRAFFEGWNAPPNTPASFSRLRSMGDSGMNTLPGNSFLERRLGNLSQIKSTIDQRVGENEHDEALETAEKIQNIGDTSKGANKASNDQDSSIKMLYQDLGTLLKGAKVTESSASTTKNTARVQPVFKGKYISHP
ncbi:hypothetical protein AX774_g2453 [Zancudomyces culisetae]|uniref:Uncharacterized protein n=1 Tax=Zancudomyces culisetae TaxID=1213189 RepID=A0A1R1PP16_ZANCU|nr:hypothetical protein AX774_g7680 [Zancudomyces culisetae]OMH82694.1 hypothetical protein AX774_g3815 [Zancudomyces culisetae]OMH84037.1 hypothetical protein AX774_g2453 [Zancudomyces culisetae]|eukprot:OMH78925.1 hypothetical protein AX774_g7680 [Zancudomyces culisetae]